MENKPNITVEFNDMEFPYKIDGSPVRTYPNHLPLPRKGDYIQMEEWKGVVKQVKFILSGNSAMIKIIC